MEVKQIAPSATYRYPGNNQETRFYRDDSVVFKYDGLPAQGVKEGVVVGIDEVIDTSEHASKWRDFEGVRFRGQILEAITEGLDWYHVDQVGHQTFDVSHKRQDIEVRVTLDIRDLERIR